MTQKFEFKKTFKSPYKAEALMDFLNTEKIDYDITLADFTAKIKEYVFLIHANRLNVTKVMRYFGEA